MCSVGGGGVSVALSGTAHSPEGSCHWWLVGRRGSRDIGCAVSHHLRVFCLLCMLRIRCPAMLTISLMMLHATFTHRIRKSMVKVSCWSYNLRWGRRINGQRKTYCWCDWWPKRCWTVLCSYRHLYCHHQKYHVILQIRFISENMYALVSSRTARWLVTPADASWQLGWIQALWTYWLERRVTQSSIGTVMDSIWHGSDSGLQESIPCVPATKIACMLEHQKKNKKSSEWPIGCIHWNIRLSPCDMSESMAELSDRITRNRDRC